MLDEERPDEPDQPYPEPDPEADLPDPESELGPDAPEAPTPPTPGDDLPAEGDVDGDLLVEFWSLVALANVALFGLAVGAMALVLSDRTDLAYGLLAAGAAAAVFTIRRYRRAEAARDATDGPDTGTTDEPSPAGAGDADRGDTDRPERNA